MPPSPFGAPFVAPSKAAATRSATTAVGGSGSGPAAVSRTGFGGGAKIPHSERLCKVLPKVMETAIKGVKDLDEQVSDV